ncbi:MAG: hypothetical protein A2826_00405 [Candidatus Doudnabacteria bacterium RIFCSPHIGHO2_01_FULL_43_23]|uniref:Anti-sigma factor antagonist n=1 Tax=Candidatus Doudnabacteria bacterium RIFCSPHIGHO2_01_FULL_43_23 TaxID=1817822 RepID=A0A1F5NSK6_9BACT|nr:MAG: hypothetical protein A2826_00405 [Candidatus Doudnabacteria bacterium RIFCSPHIGHO2_01_FULL_43_23]
MLTITERLVGEVMVLDCRGTITLNGDDDYLRVRIKEIVGAGTRKIVFNLAEVPYIDSSGLGVLVSCTTSAQNQGAKLVLLNLQKKVSDLLQVMRLYGVFQIFNDETVAVESFSQ